MIYSPILRDAIFDHLLLLGSYTSQSAMLRWPSQPPTTYSLPFKVATPAEKTEKYYYRGTHYKKLSLMTYELCYDRKEKKDCSNSNLSKSTSIIFFFLTRGAYMLKYRKLGELQLIGTR